MVQMVWLNNAIQNAQLSQMKAISPPILIKFFKSTKVLCLLLFPLHDVALFYSSCRKVKKQACLCRRGGVIAKKQNNNIAKSGLNVKESQM